jgi:S1-C subfamily serine protease
VIGSHTRLALIAVAGLLAAGSAAGTAIARTGSAPIGTGVVVIDTKLAYEGEQAAGTGLVLTSSGEVLTNNHVIRGATSIKIVVPGTGHSYTANVVGYDVSADVAVLQARNASNLRTVALGNSATVKRGQRVKAIGNAGGTGHLSRISGRVTAVARGITVSDDQDGTEHLTGLIEANAALQPGDSGGPLMNSAGKVIGMDTAASTGSGFQDVSSSAGFSIPINKATATARQIESGRSPAAIHIGATAFLGVNVVSNGYSGSGAVVHSVVTGGPAAHAGLAPGDLITRFDGRTISSPTKLGSIVSRLEPRARVSLRYVDQYGQTHSVRVTLASGPPQ